MRRRHWGVQKQPGAVQRESTSKSAQTFTIALSREAGPQGTSVAGAVAKLLGWHVYDHELVEYIAKEMGLRTALLESVDEKKQAWLRESIETSLGSLASGTQSPWASESSYVRHLAETVLALGAHGECVIVGRGAAFILPAATTLRIRLVGPVRERIAAMSKRLDISEGEAAWQVRTIDRQRTDFVQDHFFKNASDACNHDVVVNAMRFSVAECAELIVKALHCLQARRSPAE